MNRKIKFRALKDDKSNFMYGELVYDAIGNPRITHKDLSGKGLQFNSCLKDTEGQFTGLLDVNGNEIYEGDYINIGSSKFGFITNSKNETVTYEVMHKGCDFILFRTDIQLIWGRLSRLSEMNWNCQIIGNVYDNPELVESN